MNNRTFVSLVVVLAVLVGLIALSRKKAAPTSTGVVGRTGVAVLADLDLNRIEKIRLAKQGQTVEVARRDGKWVVPSLFGYPADYEKVVRSLRELGDLKVGQTVREGEKFLGDFGLPGGTNTAPESRVVTLFDGKDQSLAALNIGNEFALSGGGEFGGGEGRYVRSGNGPVVVVKESLGELTTQNNDWVKRDLTSVASADLVNIEARVSNEVQRVAVLGIEQFKVEGLKEGEEINKDNASKLAAALSNLQFSNVADIAQKPSELGLEKADTVVFKTKDGRTYTVQLGSVSAADSGRYAKLAVTYQKPAPPPLPPIPTTTNKVEIAQATNEVARLLKDFENTASKTAEKAMQESRLFGAWTYVLQSSDCDNLAMTRSRLVKASEKKPEPKKDAKPTK